MTWFGECVAVFPLGSFIVGATIFVVGLLSGFGLRMRELMPPARYDR